MTNNIDWVAQLLAMSATFVSVFLKGFQHKNVIADKYKLTFVTSYAMAIADVAVVTSVVKGGWSTAAAMGTGAAFGMIISMYLHNRFVKRKTT